MRVAFIKVFSLIPILIASVRPKGDKIGMWLGDSTAGDSIINIGKKVKERLMIDNQVSLT